MPQQAGTTTADASAASPTWPSCRKGAMATEVKQGSVLFWGGLGSSSAVAPVDDDFETAKYDRRVWSVNRKQAGWKLLAKEHAHEPDERWKGTLVNVDGVGPILFGGSGLLFSRPNEALEIFFNDVWLLEPNAQVSRSSWREMDVSGNLPSKRRAHSAVAFKKSMVVFGGRDGGSGLPLNDAWRLDATKWTWSRLRNPDSKPRKGHTACVVGTEMIVFGGRQDDDVYFGDLWSLDMSSSDDQSWSWSRLEAANEGPAPRNHHAATSWGKNKMIVVGGRSGHDASRFAPWQDVWVLEVLPSTEKKRAVWRQLEPLGDGRDGAPPPRIEASYIATGSGMILAMGQDSKRHLLNDVWELRLDPKLADASLPSGSSSKDPNWARPQWALLSSAVCASPELALAQRESALVSVGFFLGGLVLIFLFLKWRKSKLQRSLYSTSAYEPI